MCLIAAYVATTLMLISKSRVVKLSLRMSIDIFGNELSVSQSFICQTESAFPDIIKGMVIDTQRT